MSEWPEYYKVIEKIDTPFTARHIASAASSETGIASALQHNVLYNLSCKSISYTKKLKATFEKLLDFGATFEQLLEFWSNFWATFLENWSNFLRKLEQLRDSPITRRF